MQDEIYEEWRKIREPFNNYSVSNLGEIRNDKTGIIFHTSLVNGRYPEVSLFNSETGKQHTKKIHVLVGQEFCGYSEDLQRDMHVMLHHRNENLHDARASNLEVISASDNQRLRTIRSATNGRRRVVQQFSLDGDVLLAEYPWAGGTKPGWHRDAIHGCCQGKELTAYGFKWKYKPEEDLNGEIWAKIEHEDIIAKVSNLGRYERPNATRTFGSKTPSGYMEVSISGRSFKLHRLIALAFLPCENPKHFLVNHIDHDKTNNRVENLEWATHSQNIKAYYDFRKPDMSKRNLHFKPVVGIDKEGNEVQFASINDAARFVNGTTGSIAAVCKGKQKTSKGYTWRYK